MADELILQLDPRDVRGKKVRVLRRQGVIPANLYGRGIESTALQAPLTEFQRVFRAVPRNSVVNVQIAGESKTRPAVLRNVQRHPVSAAVQHIELYEIDVSRPVQSEAQLVLIGHSEAQSQGGVIVQNFDTVQLEALPLEMPAEIEVDVAQIEDFGQAIHVSDLPIPANVRVLTDPTAVVVTVVAPRLTAEDEAEEAAALAAAEAAALEAAGGEVAPGEEGEAPAEGETESSDSSDSSD